MVKRPIPRRCRVRVQSYRGRLWAYLDGVAVVRDYAPPWTVAPSAEAQVGFGAYLDDNTFSVRYGNVRLRRLTAPPEPPRAEAR